MCSNASTFVDFYYVIAWVKEAKMPSFITIAICGGFDPKMS